MAASKVFAGVAGSIVLQLLPGWLAVVPQGAVQAGWCWSASGTPNSMFGCTSAEALGKGSCGIQETCCDGYTCYLAGECAAGARTDDADKDTRDRTAPDNCSSPPAPAPTPAPTTAPTPTPMSAPSPSDTDSAKPAAYLAGTAAALVSSVAFF
eukprot:TRINITY_DN7690_c0_g1_i5.p1 TRINITY_DN7690_c0_g1~~TRINITY_DN7690_c0_g1_i5.p1  ORF type:complete len:153 (+),score=26.62 TRINITY_DN7690_c0_g1_i5:114-572(+)